MNMKRILTGVIAAGMLLSSAAFAEEATNDILLISANPDAEEVIEVGEMPAEDMLLPETIILDGTLEVDEEGTLYIKNDGIEAQVVTDENTVFVSVEGYKLTAEDFETGENARVIASSMMTLSLPAQTYGYVISKVDTQKACPIYVEVASVEVDEDGNTVALSKDGQYKVVIGGETELAPFATKQIVAAADIKEGTRLLAYSNMVTMSIPALLPAEKVVILPEIAADEPEAAPDKIAVNGEEIEAEIIDKDSAYMLPVRDICEKAGLEVKWDGELRAITVGTVQMGVTFNLGENSYTKARMMPMTLSSEPVLVNDRTYVPVDFFTELLGATATTEAGTISIVF